MANEWHTIKFFEALSFYNLMDRLIIESKCFYVGTNYCICGLMMEVNHISIFTVSHATRITTKII